MFKSRWLKTGAVVLLPLAALGVAWWATRDAKPDAGTGGMDHAAMAGGGATGGAGPVLLSVHEARRIGVTYAPVQMTELSREIRTVGQVTVDETRVRTITTRVDGFIEELHVDFVGRPVTRGEPLMRLYSPMLVTAQEELLLSRKLMRDVESGTDEARAGAADLAASARRRLSYWDVPAEEYERVERTGQVQRTLTLRASASGVVTEKNVTEGQRVMAGDVLLRVSDLSSIWVEGDIYEQDLRAIRTGQPALADFDAWPGETWQGKIAYLYPTLSPATRTARVRVAFANPGGRLMPGMYATLRITGHTDRSGAPMLTVPRNAVLATGKRQLVFVKRADGHLEPRVVETGATSDDRVQILRGVAAGDTVVASATFLVDAESNLGTALGGMGDMPGMEITTPPRKASSTADTSHRTSHKPLPKE